MPLFGPNIMNMKERKDIDGLLKILENENPAFRIEAIQALRDLKNAEALVKALYCKDALVRIEASEGLKEMGDPKALERLLEVLSQVLKYGGTTDKIEAISIIGGPYERNFLRVIIYDLRSAEALGKVRMKLSLNLVRSLLLISATEDENPFVRWYTLLALVDLGQRDSTVLDELIDVSKGLAGFFDQVAEQSRYGPVLGKALLEDGIRNGTLRALSYFRGNPVAIEAILEAFEGRFLPIILKGDLKMRYEFYALAALGDPRTRERLEYWAARGDPAIQARANVALELFGKATYDEVKSRSEPPENSK